MTLISPSEAPILLDPPVYITEISQTLELAPYQVEAVLVLTDEWSTVPFIARYRQERTGWLDEKQIRAIIEERTTLENLYRARLTALTGIDEQGKLTPEIRANIIHARTQKEVEDIYAPYRLKRKTKAMIAIEKGYQVVADMIRLGRAYEIPSILLETATREEIIEWAISIVAAEIAQDAEIRDTERRYFLQRGLMSSHHRSERMLAKLNDKVRSEIKKFDLYKDSSLSIARIKPYQMLALNRWGSLGILTVGLDRDEDSLDLIRRRFGTRITLPELETAIKDGYEALHGSLENEIRATLTSIAEDASIEVFQSNLTSLLMTRPEYGRVIIGIDPGYRTGSKIVILDTLGNPVTFSKVYLDRADEAKKIIKTLMDTHHPEVIVVGNGTASDETVALLQSVVTVPIFIVNESGASVYSASDLASEEFPDLDATDRGTISIARRYIDPLSELVKVPVGSIGVGMYQHDITAKRLEEKLGYTVEDVVNQVGINVNTASVSVLQYISGLDKRSAKKIYNHRPYASRSALSRVLSAKGYEQAAGFLRVPESECPYDDTNIHPEQYALADRIISEGIMSSDYDRYEDELRGLYSDVTRETIAQIRSAYEARGRDPRIYSGHTEARVKKETDTVKEWDILMGIVRNVVAFGAFVDVGLKHDGLIHVSEIADTYVKNPLDYLQVGQKVSVRITRIDPESGKIQLSRKGL